MTETAIMLLTFLAGFLLVFAGNMVVFDLFERHRGSAVRSRVVEEMRVRERERARQSPLLTDDLREASQEALRETAFETEGFWNRLRALTEQSGLDLTPKLLLTVVAAGGLLLGGIAMFLTQGMSLGNHVLITLAAAASGVAVPLFAVHMKRMKRLDLMREQIPESFDLMARVLRSGQAMTMAMQAVGQEFGPPISSEFWYCYEQQHLGLPAEFALRDLARRTGLLEIQIFVMAVLIHQQTGGNLATLLENIASITRERFFMRGKIRR